MPNKRHPARRFVGFWATAFLKDSLKKHAIKKRINLSVLMANVLTNYLLKNKNGKGHLPYASNFSGSESNASD